MFSRPRKPALASITVLIVDDSRPMRDILKAILRGLGVGEVLMAGDVAGALEIVGETRPDLIFVDWCMQPEGGLDLVRTIRNDPDSSCPFVPIIMCTGHTEPHHVMTARDAGVTEFLAKPVSIDAVARRLEEVIRRPRLFVRARPYFGPDRRRMAKGFNGFDRRAAGAAR